MPDHNNCKVDPGLPVYCLPVFVYFVSRDAVNKIYYTILYKRVSNHL